MALLIFNKNERLKFSRLNTMMIEIENPKTSKLIVCHICHRSVRLKLLHQEVISLYLPDDLPLSYSIPTVSVNTVCLWLSPNETFHIISLVQQLTCSLKAFYPADPIDSVFRSFCRDIFECKPYELRYSPFKVMFHSSIDHFDLEL